MSLIDQVFPSKCSKVIARQYLDGATGIASAFSNVALKANSDELASDAISPGVTVSESPVSVDFDVGICQSGGSWGSSKNSSSAIGKAWTISTVTNLMLFDLGIPAP